MTSSSSSSVLDYGRAPPARWRRLIRWTIVALLLIALAFAGLFAFRNLSLWLARREGYAKVTAWYQQARTSVVPAGTLLYSENPSDFATARFGHVSPGSHVAFDQRQPMLRMIAYEGDGRVPVVIPNDVLYIHEHLRWAVPRGSRPNVFCIGYRGLVVNGLPYFSSIAYELVDPTGKVRFPSMGAAAIVQSPRTRSLANLRIFAGLPNATDPTRFSLPFESDGGTGRFEFQTDVDVADGGQLAPDVTIAWDDAPATRPDR